MLVFPITLIIICVVVVLRWATDKGIRERRMLKPAYGELFDRFREFEAAGGRAQELEWSGVDEMAAVVRASIARVWLHSFATTVVLTFFWWLFGWPLLILLILVAAYTIAMSVIGTLLLDAQRQPERRTARNYLNVVLGAFLEAVLHAAATFVVWEAAHEVDRGDWLWGALLAFLGVLVADVAHIPSRVLQSLLGGGAGVAFSKEASEDTVLYLRSFRDDRKRIFSPISPELGSLRLIPGARVRIEEVLATLFVTSSSNIVCIGRPGERRSFLGARRACLSDDAWRDAVSQTAARASTIVLMAGVTDGLAWEINQLKSMNMLGKLLILLPTDDPLGTMGRYATIVAQLDIPDKQILSGDQIFAVEWLAVPALCFEEDGSLVHLVAAGRSWLTYSAAIVRFQMALSGRAPLESTGSFAQAMDPIHLAAYAVEMNESADDVREIIHRLPHSGRSVVALAWVLVKVESDLSSARTLVTQGRADHPEEPALVVAEQFLQTFRPGGDSSGMLGDDCRKPPAPSADKQQWSKPPRALWRWPATYDRATEAIDAQQFDVALSSAQRGNAIAVSAGVPIAAAYSDIQQAQAHLGLTNLLAAHTIARAVLDRGRMANVRISQTFALESDDVRDDAFCVLTEIANQGSDLWLKIETGTALYEHRVAWRERELAANVAEGLAELYLDNRLYNDAETWSATAADAFRVLGRPAKLSGASDTRARALATLGRLAEASIVSAEAIDAARTAGDPELESVALELHLKVVADMKKNSNIDGRNTLR